MSAETPTGISRTVTETILQDESVPGTSSSGPQEPPVLRLRLQKPRNGKKVQWTNGTVDNEHMNKKKSKCCCIYVKPRAFGESSSESEDECEHCFGHVELKKKNQKVPPMPVKRDDGDNDDGEPHNADGIDGNSLGSSNGGTPSEPPSASGGE
ncbi:E3 ubiquitin-protein ligase PPP1R11-like [Anopheles arabiensis]|uniref:E3 ubiquitin-protein ligase PPP1R11-like n=1 Tax=Anopheles arabiensis TaxID=7173 RepID=UPI001AADE1A5|nr:E3 ubiquitin-protein ligase PPP1R11-like [Anopheles arabiensis]